MPMHCSQSWESQSNLTRAQMAAETTTDETSSAGKTDDYLRRANNGRLSDEGLRELLTTVLAITKRELAGH